jgi:hypothetical protein
LAVSAAARPCGKAAWRRLRSKALLARSSRSRKPRSIRLTAAGDGEAIQQSLLINGFGQKAQRSRLERAGAMLFIRVSGDKNDRNMMTFALQGALQIKAIQARHVQIGYQAGRMLYGSGIQEQLGGCERSRPVAE